MASSNVTWASPPRRRARSCLRSSADVSVLAAADLVAVITLLLRSWMREGGMALQTHETGESTGLGHIILSSDSSGNSAFAARFKVTTDEGLEIAIKNAIDIANFDAGAKILRQTIRLKHIVANL